MATNPLNVTAEKRHKRSLTGLLWVIIPLYFFNVESLLGLLPLTIASCSTSVEKLLKKKKSLKQKLDFTYLIKYSSCQAVKHSQCVQWLL